MKVAYSVAGKLGGPGLGTTAGQAVRQIFARGLLRRVYCSSKTPTTLPIDLIRETRTDWLERVPKLPSNYRWFLKDVTHDFLTGMSLSPADIFHVWNGHGLFSMRKAKKMRMKIVVERASSHPLTHERIINDELRMRGLNGWSMLSWNRSRLLKEIAETDFITLPSDFAYRSMLENGVPEAKLVKIPFGVDLERFHPSLRVTSSKFRVLFAGQVGFRKGVLYLLEAWQNLKLREALLTIVGQPDPEIKPFLGKFLSDSTVRFLPFTYNLKGLYQESDVFAFPSLEEGSALVTYEALACGLPVVTTFESGSVVADGQEGFIVPAKNVGALAAAIKRIYDDGDLRNAMTRNARLKAEAYSWDRYGQSLISFYRRIIAP